MRKANGRMDKTRREKVKDAKGTQKRFWSRVRDKEKETVTHIRRLDGELRSGGRGKE